jgi:hypothetical protein
MSNYEFVQAMAKVVQFYENGGSEGILHSGELAPASPKMAKSRSGSILWDLHWQPSKYTGGILMSCQHVREAIPVHIKGIEIRRMMLVALGSIYLCKAISK